jgi:hypothetical protein
MIPIEVGHHSEMMSATSAGANQPSGRERREIGGSGYIQFYEAEAQTCSEIALIACIPNLSTLSFRRLAGPLPQCHSRQQRQRRAIAVHSRPAA